MSRSRKRLIHGRVICVSFGRSKKSSDLVVLFCQSRRWGVGLEMWMCKLRRGLVFIRVLTASLSLLFCSLPPYHPNNVHPCREHGRSTCLSWESCRREPCLVDWFQVP
jgi:hypothetical protein